MILLIAIKITELFYTGVTITVNTAVSMELVYIGDLLEYGLQIVLEITFPYYCTYMYIVVKVIVQYIKISSFKEILPSKVHALSLQSNLE